MAKLEALLEQRGVASPREVSEALARSQLHGGDITTSLLQFSNIDEAALSDALSECYGLPAASVGMLPTEVAAAAPVPREVAERYCCFPVANPPGELVLAVARPLDAGLKEELGFALGMRLSERVALEVRIRQAIARCYGVPLSERDQQAIARLEGAHDGARNAAPFAAWPDEQLSALPRPPSELPPPVEDRPEWTREWDGVPAAPEPRPKPAQAAAPRARRRGPFTLGMAREELARASSRNQVLDAFFSFACQFFEYSALFGVHSSLAEGLHASGPGAANEEIQAVGVPLDLPSSLSEAAESCAVRITRLGHEGIDRTLALDLRRQLTTRVLILPVCLRGRCAVLLYGDNGSSDVVEREVTDVVALAPDVAAAFARIILQRKREAARQAPIDGAELSESLVPPPPAEPQPSAAASEPQEERPEPEFSLPVLPNKNRDRSRSNGRGRSSFPPATLAEAAAGDAGGSIESDGNEPAATEHAALETPAEPAAAEPAAEAPVPGGAAGDPVFLPEHSEPPPQPVPVMPRGNILHTAIARPARVLHHQPRLPSVIVDHSATEQTPWTRAGAATQPPQSARNTLPRSKQGPADPLETATVRPSSQRLPQASPAPARRTEILPMGPLDTSATDPAPPNPALDETASLEARVTDRAPAPPALIDPALADAPPPAASPPAPFLLAATRTQLLGTPAAATVPVPQPAATAPKPEVAAPEPVPAVPDVLAPAAAPAPAVAAPADAPDASDAAPLKPLEHRPITAPPRRSSAAPLPPFSNDRPSAPPLAPFSNERRSSPPLAPFTKDRPSAPAPAPGKAGSGSAPPPGRTISIARPDSPSVRPVPRTPTQRPPDLHPRRSVPAASSGNTTTGPAGTEAARASVAPPAPLPDAPSTAAAAEVAAAAATAATPATAAAPDAVVAETAAASPSTAPAAPPSQRNARDAGPPSSPPPELEIEAMIEALCQGNPKAVQDLARIGAATVPQLMARFPGPVVSERAGPSSRASECGPLLQALASIGSPAVPEIMRSTEDQDSRVRRWATLLLGEMPGPDACRAVVQRLADDVPRVHQAALDAARLLLSSSAANLFRKTLFEVAEAEDAPLNLRLRTLEHVARLRDSASVPRLIAFLSLDTEPVVHKALWALTVITRQDFGRDAQSWSEWWQAHQSKHRFQWLIEALDQRDPRLRKAAADELLIEAKDSFGYSEELPQPERLAAQRRYQEWWETTGARRFGRLQ